MNKCGSRRSRFCTRLPNGVATRTFGLPVRFDGQTTALRRPPPALGQHNDEVLGPLRGKGRGA